MSASSSVRSIVRSAQEIIAYVNEDYEFLAVCHGISRLNILIVEASHSGEDSTAALFVIDGGRLSKIDENDGKGKADLSVCAGRADWSAFFSPPSDLKRPYQSYWGMLRVLSPQRPEIYTRGDKEFGRHARTWRILLDRVRDVLTGRIQSRVNLKLPEGEEVEDDVVVGRYFWTNMTEYGKVKMFYETAGSGPQAIIFLHTAGSDSRQYHSLMNIAKLQQMCTMYAFDLPAHGRSSLGTKQIPETYALTEESYIEAIQKFIHKLRLKDAIVCGASMAGHVCLAAAIRSKELGIRGSIPCEGCDHLPFSQPIYEIKGSDSSLLDPERVCGMCAPTSPEYYKRQIWWQYSSQGYNIFAGDLKFYFRGWDGRGRIEKIDTAHCPVYMLTGEFDYSCTTEASKATAEAIPGARFEAMPGLGHFPLTENPSAVLQYLIRAIEFIQDSRR